MSEEADLGIPHFKKSASGKLVALADILGRLIAASVGIDDTLPVNKLYFGHPHRHVSTYRVNPEENLTLERDLPPFSDLLGRMHGLLRFDFPASLPALDVASLSPGVQEKMKTLHALTNQYRQDRMVMLKKKWGVALKEERADDTAGCLDLNKKIAGLLSECVTLGFTDADGNVPLILANGEHKKIPGNNAVGQTLFCLSLARAGVLAIRVQPPAIRAFLKDNLGAAGFILSTLEERIGALPELHDLYENACAHAYDGLLALVKQPQYLHTLRVAQHAGIRDRYGDLTLLLDRAGESVHTPERLTSPVECAAVVEYMQKQFSAFLPEAQCRHFIYSCLRMEAKEKSVPRDLRTRAWAAIRGHSDAVALRLNAAMDSSMKKLLEESISSGVITERVRLVRGFIAEQKKQQGHAGRV